jgi:hypothetical protein
MMQMNALRRLFANHRRVAGLLAAAGGSALLAGCLSDPFPDARIDPASPVAGDVGRMTRANADFPSFNEIPAAPQDIRPVAQYGQQAGALDRLRDQLERETADNTWTLKNTEGFAAEARGAVPDLPPPTAADAEAFARELRERATPPPPR